MVRRMVEDKSLTTTAKSSAYDKNTIPDQIFNLYTTEKKQWLGASIAGVTLLYLTSEEIWKMFDGSPSPEMSFVGMVVFSLLFLSGLYLVRYNDILTNVTKDERKSILFTVSTLLIDLLVVLFVEIIVVCANETIPTDINLIPGFLLTGALPICLGVGSIKTMSSSRLKKECEELLEEITSLKNDVLTISEKWVKKEAETEALYQKIVEQMKRVGK